MITKYKFEKSKKKCPEMLRQHNLSPHSIFVTPKPPPLRADENRVSKPSRPPGSYCAATFPALPPPLPHTLPPPHPQELLPRTSPAPPPPEEEGAGAAEAAVLARDRPGGRARPVIRGPGEGLWGVDGRQQEAAPWGRTIEGCR